MGRKPVWCGLAWSDLVLYILALDLSYPVISSREQNKCPITRWFISHFLDLCIVLLVLRAKHFFSQILIKCKQGWPSSSSDWLVLTDSCDLGSNAFFAFHVLQLAEMLSLVSLENAKVPALAWSCQMCVLRQVLTNTVKKPVRQGL